MATGMEVCGSHFDVVAGRVMFGEVISQIEVSLLPVDLELTLFDLVLDPIETHVHGLGPLDFGLSVGKPICG